MGKPSKKVELTNKACAPIRTLGLDLTIGNAFSAASSNKGEPTRMGIGSTTRVMAVSSVLLVV